MAGVGGVVLSVLVWVGVVLGTLVAVLIAGFVAVPPLTRRLTDRWGATRDEAAEDLPGDALVVDAQQSATRAISIDAPPELVMRLVRQQGYKRAGWHGWDWFYDATGSSGFVDGRYSRRVVPELQDIRVGDRVWINPQVSYEVAEDVWPTVDRAGVFLLYAGGGPDGEVLRAEDAARASSASGTWLWHIRPAEDGGTRLVLRIRADMRGQGAFLAWLFDNPLDLGGALFAAKTLRGIKRTAEALAESG